MDCPLGATNSSKVLTSTCSGHGRCLTLSEVSSLWHGTDNMEFGGLTVFPGTYDTADGWHAWDADQIQGCVCDPPYTGFNCTSMLCPTGDDFSDPKDKYGLENHNEVLRIECGADSGSFR